MGPIDPEVIAAVTVPVSFTIVIIALVYNFTRLRIAKAKPSADIENRLARLEVAIDDMTAEIARMTESQRFLTAALTQRGLPAEVPHGSE